jgi:uncharacterized protein (TIGR03435 family)
MKAWTKLFLTAGTLPALVVAGMLTPRLLAQSSATPQWQTDAGGKMAFEVASVKRNMSMDHFRINFPLGPGSVMPQTCGLLSVSDVPLRLLIAFAYKMTPGQTQYLILQVPNWIDSERFDIEASADGNPTKDQFRLMVQSLLADRFKMTIHTETRRLPVFAVVLAKPGKTGPQLTPHTDDTTCLALGQPVPPTLGTALPPLPCGGFDELTPSAPGRLRLGARKVTLELFANAMSGFENLDRPGVDRTGLSGTFDMSFEFSPQIQNPAPGTPGLQAGSTPDPLGPSLMEALQEQLGLKLESQTGPVDVMVVDRLEQPSEN